MKHFVLTSVMVFASISVPASAEPFKLGTFEYRGAELIGIVLQDRYVIDLVRANRSLERRQPLWVELPMPKDMKELIGRYEYGVRDQIHAVMRR